MERADQIYVMVVRSIINIDLIMNKKFELALGRIECPMSIKPLNKDYKFRKEVYNG